MKSQWALIVAIFFALVIAVFSVANVNAVTISYVFGEARWPLILVILGSFFIGGLVASTIGIIKVYQLKRVIRQLETELNSSQAFGLNEEPTSEHVKRENKEDKSNSRLNT
ncbi:lipopolysaccharide assembly LapA domain-containing protein [Camelliibacillus cellulosilyticus]|uniref:Lipopolysaccharide assembly LapA domain-containing protein n=1 Tax=Camelliibacillus cellulosilyticus TaxID=2174486 RepID=A0ABV9GMH1_9BACL